MQILDFGKPTYLAPGPGNPRNSEGAFLPLADGRIAYAYSRYHADSWDDHAACAIAIIYSHDQGETWDTEHIDILVDAADYGERNVMSVSLMRLGNGDIGLFYLLKRPGIITEYRMRRYGRDFSDFLEEVLVLPKGYPGYYVVNNDRVLRRADGTLVVPAAWHPSGIYRDGGQQIDERSQACFFTSPDDGHTWQMQRGILRLADTYSDTGLQEPGLAEIKGGVLYCYARTDRRMQYEAVSLDGGAHWFGPQPSRFTSPPSPMLIKQNPYNGRYYAIWNPIPEYVGRVKPTVWTGGRNPLVIADSADGVTFSPAVPLENDETRGFCYPALCFLEEKTALLAYCSGGTEDGACLNRVTMRKIVIG